MLLMRRTRRRTRNPVQGEHAVRLRKVARCCWLSLHGNLAGCSLGLSMRCSTRSAHGWPACSTGLSWTQPCTSSSAPYKLQPSSCHPARGGCSLDMSVRHSSRCAHGRPTYSIRVAKSGHWQAPVLLQKPQPRSYDLARPDCSLWMSKRRSSRLGILHMGALPAA